MKYAMTFNGDTWFFFTMKQLTTIFNTTEFDIRQTLQLGGQAILDGKEVFITNEVPPTKTIH